jgi:exodeoxyribonuclease-5
MQNVDYAAATAASRETNVSVLELSNDQQTALDSICRWFTDAYSSQVFVLAGYAGTGKSTLIQYAVKALGLDPKLDVAYLAYTGKAASVLRIRGCNGQTIHSFQYRLLEQDEKTRKLRFVRKNVDTMFIKLVIVDEISMVSGYILEDLISSGIKILMVGDPCQLPPVSNNDPELNAPRGICGTEYLQKPNALLTNIHRQAVQNPILALSQHIREGHMRFTPGQYADENGVNRLTIIHPDDFWNDASWLQYMTRCEQVLVGTNNTRRNVNATMRGLMGLTSEVDDLPVRGDKLICTYNNWDVPFVDSVGGVVDYVTNGSICVATSEIHNYDRRHRLFNVDLQSTVYPDAGIKSAVVSSQPFDNRAPKYIKLPTHIKQQLLQMDYGWAVTTHKAQGSEFDSVVVVDESQCFGESRSRWLYTAVTRASKYLTLVTRNTV